MSKFFNFIAMLLCVISFGIFFTACGEKPISLELKDGTLQTKLYLNDTLNTDDVILIVTYDGQKVVEVKKNNNMQFSSIDTTTVGTKMLTITYLDLIANVEITVLEKPETTQIVVTSFEMPQFILDYQSASSQILDDPNTDVDESRNSFVQTNKTYKVGDDNAFVIKPRIVGYVVSNGVMGDIQSLDYAPSIYTLEQKDKDGDTYITLEGNALDEIVFVDEQNYALYFTQLAVGNTYRLTIQANIIDIPANLSFEFEVVDGYNVHSEEELSVLDNNISTQDDWAQYKQENGIKEDINPQAIILHKNMTITDEHIPDNYFYQADDSDVTDALLSSLRNKKSIYTHDTPKGETFTLYGNYFTIDASAVSLVNVKELQLIDKNNNLYGDSALIAFGGNNDEHPTTDQGKVVIESLRMNGNGNRGEDENLIGGLMGILSTSDETTINNTIFSAFVTHFNTRPHNGEGVGDWEIASTISNSKWYDSFSTMVYYCGVKYNYIENSILLGSGGPVIDLVHFEPHNFPDSRYTTVEVKNSTLKTWVNGSEAWFVYNNATETAAQLLALDQLLLQSSSWAKADGIIENAKAMAPQGRANIIALSAAWDPLNNKNPLLNRLTFKNSEGKVIYDYDMNNQTLKFIASQIDALQPGASAILPFFNSGNSFASVTTSNLMPNGIANVFNMQTLYTQGQALNLDDTTRAYIQDFYDGDYMGFYLNGVSTLGVVAQFIDC